MSSLRQIATHRRLVLTALLMVVLVAAFAATPSSAATGRCGTEFDYYSNSSHSSLVGVRGWLPFDCGCASYSWGSVTSYFDVTDAVC